jgi:hypothetical protein
MPYITKTIKEAKKEFKKSDKTYRLCYVDEIPQTTFGYRPEIKEKYKFLEGLTYEQWQEVYWQYPEYRMEDLPNPEYVKGEKEFYAYFTPKPLYEQWGDDWNDAPYEYNAEIPYDDVILETEEKDGLKWATKIDHYDIIQIPFAVKSFYYKLPKDYSYGGNSPFSVDMINSGAVAWIYDPADGKMENMTSIQAGCTIYEFLQKLKRIEKCNPEYQKYEDED